MQFYNYISHLLFSDLCINEILRHRLHSFPPCLHSCQPGLHIIIIINYYLLLFVIIIYLHLPPSSLQLLIVHIELLQLTFSGQYLQNILSHQHSTKKSFCTQRTLFVKSFLNSITPYYIPSFIRGIEIDKY